MYVNSLTPAAYEALLVRGWRRCGQYVYKPIMDKTCCPQYTIRTDAQNVKLTRGQRRVVRKVNGDFIRKTTISFAEFAASPPPPKSTQNATTQSINDIRLAKFKPQPFKIREINEEELSKPNFMRKITKCRIPRPPDTNSRADSARFPFRSTAAKGAQQTAAEG